MKTLFHYNWNVRADWYRWCEEVSEEELLRVRIGGVGGILHTLFHIIDVEWSWIQILQGKPDYQESFDNYRSLAKVRELDRLLHQDVKQFVANWDACMEHKTIHSSNPDGSVSTYTWGDVMRHVIAHEIHHIGQISVWAREIGLKPVSANVLDRDLVSKN